MWPASHRSSVPRLQQLQDTTELRLVVPVGKHFGPSQLSHPEALLPMGGEPEKPVGNALGVGGIAAEPEAGFDKQFPPDVRITHQNGKPARKVFEDLLR